VTTPCEKAALDRRGARIQAKKHGLRAYQCERCKRWHLTSDRDAGWRKGRGLRKAAR
jgi:hypothetical protein